MDSNFDKAYQQALEIAQKQLLEKDLSRMGDASGTKLTASGAGAVLELVYLNAAVRIELPAFAFSCPGDKPVHIWDRILLLHYLLHGDAAPQPARPVGFKELKSAALYYSLFEARCLRPLVKAYGSRPGALLDDAQGLGAEILATGDAAVRLQVLPRISLSIILWQADDEFPASASILFDSSIEHYLSAEDIVVLCQRTVLKLLGKW